VLRREGQIVNRKKVQRLWREEGLRVPPKRRKRQRLGTSTTPADRLQAIRPDHVWALDYQFDVTATGRVIKILHVVDEFTRESLADLIDHSIDADTTVACLDKIVDTRGRHPSFIRCDNGPELTANALRDWCRFTGCGTSYIEPGSPWENPWVESYGSRMRDELLAIEQFDTILEAQILIADWQTDCYAATNAGVALSNRASDATPKNRRPHPTLTPDRALRRRVNPLLSVRTWRRS
jgi:putative transposase